MSAPALGETPPGQSEVSLAESYIDHWKTFYPTAALAAGDRASAFGFEDFSCNRVADWIAVNRQTLQHIGELPPAKNLDERIDRRVLARQARAVW